MNSSNGRIPRIREGQTGNQTSHPMANGKSGARVLASAASSSLEGIPVPWPPDPFRSTVWLAIRLIGNDSRIQFPKT